jgi:hypothetical protein
MATTAQPDLRYPVGRFSMPASLSLSEIDNGICELDSLPGKLRAAVDGLTDAQMDTPYRPDGWTVRQVLHHVPDSHLNAYVRFKLALTEDTPLIKPYEESRWAELPDSRVTPIDVSLTLLESLHTRWVMLLRALNDAQWARPYRHPEIGVVRLDQGLALYAWHSRHHTAHITGLRERMGW